jgi:hypothetical protein
MKTLAYCWNCNKEYDITDKENYEFKCECGGYVISPSGKLKMKLVPENDEDKKILGIQVEKEEKEEKEINEQPFPKVFRMDEYSWVCAMNQDDAISWFINNSGVDEEDLNIKECDIDEETMLSEISITDITDKLEKMDNGDEFSLSITRRYGSFFINDTFKEVIARMIEASDYESVTKEPFEICSTEW